MRPQAVIFDLFQTLVDVDSAPGFSTSVLLGLDPVVWNRKVIEDSPHHALGTVLDPYESVRLMVHAIDPTIAESRIRRAVQVRPKRFRHALLHVLPEILDALDQLRGQGLRLGLISNAGRDEIEAWPESPLAERFDVALFSCDEQLMKPDPAIYLRAAGRLGVPAATCLFVGDGGSREHSGAKAAGMKTVLMLGLLQQSHPEIAAGRPRDTDWVMQSMEELVAMVGSRLDPQ